MKTVGVAGSRVASFDVFGTLLFRRVAEPGRRFAFLAGQGEAAGRWSQSRIEAEHASARSKGPDLYSLEEIYIHLGAPSSGPQKEMDLEEKLCFPVTEAGRLLAAARQKGSRVLFSSDMYLPGQFIQGLLEKHGLWQEGDRLFVSHEQGAAKHGGLFQKICKELSVRPEQIEHTGDNHRSDVLVPARLGVRTVHFRATDLGRYEAEWIRQGGEGGEAVADAIRATRLQFPEELDAKGQAVWETASGVAGPLFVSYVLWLEKQARELGLERLFFISRDGRIFKKIYDRLFQGHPGSPKSRYLYGSRQAWAGVRAARLNEEDITWLTKPGSGTTLAQFARRCGLTGEGIPVLPWAHPPRGDEPLAAGHLAELASFLRVGPLRELVLAAGRETRARAASYLRQEGLGDDRNGLVDLGWFGNLQEYVEKMVPENPPVVGFYLDLRSRPRIQQEGRARAYWERPLCRGIDQANSITLLEILAGSQEGSVVGYREKNGAWEPVQDLKKEEKGPEVWADLQHQAILAFLEEILQQPGGLENLDMDCEVARENFRQFLRHPSLAEAEAYGEVRFVSNQEGGSGITLAPRVGLGEAWTFFRKGFWKRQIVWPPGMVARATGIQRWLLQIRYGVTQGADLFRSAITRFIGLGT